MHEEIVNSGTLYNKNLKDIQKCLQKKEILESSKIFNPEFNQSG